MVFVHCLYSLTSDRLRLALGDSLSLYYAGQVCLILVEDGFLGLVFSTSRKEGPFEG